MNERQIYAIGMIVNAMVTAMGMQAENMQREVLGESMAYTDGDFVGVLDDNGVTHDGLLKMLRGE